MIIIVIVIIKETGVGVSRIVERWLKRTVIGIGICSLHCSAAHLVVLLSSCCVNVSVNSKRVLLVFVFVAVVSSIVKGCHGVIN